MTNLRASLIVPARNEHEQILVFLARISESVSLPVEVLIVVDSNEDSTLKVLGALEFVNLSVRALISTYGSGPARAIRYGIDAALAEVVVVTMADGSDDPQIIDDLIKLIERGCSIAAASRYMPGGQQIGGPRFKRFLSKSASRILYSVLGVGTHDSTNSFKAYSKEFILAVGIESDRGFEIGLELVAKAHRHNRIIAEVPTIWIDRVIGESNFKLKKWLPHYLRWFFYAFGSKLSS